MKYFNEIYATLLFILGIYFIIKSVSYERQLYENFDNKISEDECPDVLIEEDNKINYIILKKL